MSLRASYEAVFDRQQKRFFMYAFYDMFFCFDLVEWLWDKILGGFHSSFVGIQASQVCCYVIYV